MPPDPRQRAVAMIAGVIVAATGRDRVAVNDLLAGCHTLSALRDLSAHDIGRLLKDTAWRRAQWRQGGGRVRGFVAPGVTVKSPDRAQSAIVRVLINDKRQVSASNA